MSTVSGKKIKFVALSIISLPTLFQSPITYAEERKTEEDRFYRSGAQLIQTGNHESITSGTFVGDAYGGSDKLGGDVTLNSLTVSGNGTKLDGAGYGGYTENGGNIFHNAISITDGAEVTQHVYGGWSDTGDISENTVTVSGGSQIKGSIYGGQSGGGSISKNSVTVSDGNTVVEGSVMGGSTAGASGAMTDNDVTIRSGATVKGGVYGAHDRNASSNFDMIGNTVEVRGSGTEVGWVTGGYTLGSGTSSNVVVVKDSAAVAQDVYGGFSQNGAAKNNYVSITGGTVGRDVAGGYSFYGQATNNKVIVGHSQISGSIYGGYGGGYDTSIDLISDNEFHLVSALRLGSDQTVANFEKYNFDIGADIEAGDTMLHVGSPVDLAPELNNPNNVESQVNITGVSKSTKLVVGDKITLINKTENA
ncbi:hypothetical protein E1162_02015, partial [Rhodobacteraceae bacterium RKSG542]|uniref:hypothetical protein n=1 Tax=Pseudovibrio flavus TaxID=2529854 RepID=UPI003527B651|nr:hypothetical protein [Pseudovibrio flavus]